MNIDEKITQVLHEAGENIKADEWLMTRIKQDIINEKRQGERTIMKKKHIKWIAVGAMLLMTSTAAYAVTNLSNHEGHTYHNQDFKEPPTVSQMNEKVGYAPQYVEQFSNGWTFENASIVYNQSSDNEPANTQEWKSIDFNYKNQSIKGGWVTLSTTNMPYHNLSEGETVQLEAQQGNLSGLYFEQKFKFVPPNYALTEADKAAEANGSLVISYGSAEVKEEVMRNIIWQNNGVSYQLFTNCSEVDRNVLLDMANEILTEE